MNKIEELIEKLCPDGVEYKTLGECCYILDNQRKPVTKSTRKSGKYPYYGANGIQDYVADYIFEGTFVLVAEDGSVLTEKGTPVVNWAEGKIWVNNHAHIIKEKNGILLRYLFYFIQTINISHLVHGNIPKLTGKDFKKLQVPVPPMEVQREIVEVLDNFAELSAELSAELQARRKQYEFYRNKLLAFEEPKVEWKKLEEVAKFRRGSFPQPYTNSNYYGGEGAMPFVQVADMQDNSMELRTRTKQTISKIAQSKSIFVKSGTILVSLQGTIGRVAISQYDCFVDRTIAIFDCYKININKKYFAYQLKQKFGVEKEKARGTTLKTITKEEFSNFAIPIPPLEIQEKIVDVLDNFDAICSDLGIGLPAEIEARQKQFEYYREKLLTFNPRPITILAEQSRAEQSRAEQIRAEQSRAEQSRADDLIRLLQYVYGFVSIKVKDIFTRIKGTPITAEKMKQISNDEGNVVVFAGGKTVVKTFEKDIPNANITRMPAVLVQSRGLIDFIYFDKPFTFKNEMWAYTINNTITLKYLYYILKQNLKYFRDNASGMGSLPQISLSITEDFVLKLPSLKKQQEIVEILDNFDKLVNGLSNGLPAEIEARQKQYEFYRDKLLNFKRKN